MAAFYLQAKPSGDRFQRMVCQIGICYGCKKPDAQRPRLFPGQTGASAFALQYRQVEADRVADEDAVADELLELRPCIREAAGSVNIGIGDAVDERSLGRDCFTGIDEQIELSFPDDLAMRDADRANLDHACLGGVGPGCFGVDGGSRNCYQQCRAARRLQFRLLRHSR